jgi:predicted GTPase
VKSPKRSSAIRISARSCPQSATSAKELAELQTTINASDADAVIVGTPSDLARLMRLDKPIVRVRHEFAEVGEPRLSGLIEDFLRSRDIGAGPA